MLFVAQHHDVGVIIGVEHQPFYLHLCNHDKPGSSYSTFGS